MTYEAINKKVEELNRYTGPHGVTYFWTGDPKGYCMLYEKTTPGKASFVCNARAKKFLDLVGDELRNFPRRGLKGQRVRLRPGINISLDDHEYRDKIRSLAEGVVIQDNLATLDVNFSGVAINGIPRDNFQVQEWKDIDFRSDDPVGEILEKASGLPA